MNNRRSETSIKCPRPDTHLTYMMDIALTTEFTIPARVLDDRGRSGHQVVHRRTGAGAAGRS
jgi:hypothetical protein